MVKVYKNKDGMIILPKNEIELRCKDDEERIKKPIDAHKNNTIILTNQ